MPRIPVQVLTSTPQGSSNPAVTTPRSVAPANVRVLGPVQPREQFPQRALNAVQTASNQATAKAKARSDADQNVIPQVSFTGGVALAVKHRLGRAFVGATLINPRGGFLAYKVASNSDARLDASQVMITCQNTCTADVVIW